VRVICITLDVHKTIVSFLHRGAKIFWIQRSSGVSKTAVVKVTKARKGMRQCRIHSSWFWSFALYRLKYTHALSASTQQFSCIVLHAKAELTHVLNSKRLRLFPRSQLHNTDSVTAGMSSSFKPLKFCFHCARPHPASYSNGTGVFFGDKAAGA
jgi:hypothetical protein